MKYNSIYSINLDIIEKLGGDKGKKFDSVYSEAKYIAEDLMGAPTKKWDSIYQILLWILDNYEPIPPEPECEKVIDIIIDVVDSMFDYEGNKLMVYSKEFDKWYMLTDTGEYEEYGIIGNGLDVPKYIGKLTIADGHEYEWSGTEWVDLGEASSYGAGIFDGASWFDSSIKGKNNIKVAARFSINDTTKTTGIVGSRYTYSSTLQNGCCMFGVNTKKMDFQLGNKVIANVDINNNEYYEGEFYLYSADGTNTNVKAACKLTKDGVVLQDETYTVSGANRTADGNGYNIFVGAINQSGGKFGLGESTISYVKIYENIDADGNGELTHDFRFQYVDGVGKMIDIITGDVFDNKGTGNVIVVEVVGDLPKEYDVLDAPITFYEADTYCDLYDIPNSIAYEGIYGISNEDEQYYQYNDGLFRETSKPISGYKGLIVHALEDGAIAMNHYGTNTDSTAPVLQYSMDGVEWIDWNGEEIPLAATQEVAFRGTKMNSSGSGDTNLPSNRSTFTSSCDFIIKGDLVSLIDNGECTATTVPPASFAALFNGCDSLLDAKDAMISATGGSYGIFIFNGCSRLINAPTLMKSGTLGWFEWSRMFQGCVNLQYIAIPLLTSAGNTQGMYEFTTGVKSEDGTVVVNTALTYKPKSTWKVRCKYGDIYSTIKANSFTNYPAQQVVSGTLQCVGKLTYTHPDWITIEDDAYVDRHELTITMEANFGGARSGNIVFTAGNKTLSIAVSQLAYTVPTFNDALRLTSIDGGAIALNNYGGNIPVVFVRKNDGEAYMWQGEEIQLNAGEYIELEGYSVSNSSSVYSTFAMQGNFNASADVMSLIRLASTTMKDGEFCRLFYGCEGLITAPKLTADLIAYNAYNSMFYGCKNLTEAPIISATRVSVFSVSGYGMKNMFNGCTSLVKSPKIWITNASSYGNGSASDSMYEGCSNMNYIFDMRTNAFGYTNFSKGVASEGIFVKNIEATWDVSGDNGVPVGWTVIYYDMERNKYYLDKERATQCDEYGNLIPM